MLYQTEQNENRRSIYFIETNSESVDLYSELLYQTEQIHDAERSCQSIDSDLLNQTKCCIQTCQASEILNVAQFNIYEELLLYQT